MLHATAAMATANGISEGRKSKWKIKSLQEYHTAIK